MGSHMGTFGGVVLTAPLALPASKPADTRGSRPATWADVARGSLGAGGALLWDASLAVTCFGERPCVAWGGGWEAVQTCICAVSLQGDLNELRMRRGTLCCCAGLLVATLVVLGDLLVGQGGSGEHAPGSLEPSEPSRGHAACRISLCLLPQLAARLLAKRVLPVPRAAACSHSSQPRRWPAERLVQRPAAGAGRAVRCGAGAAAVCQARQLARRSWLGRRVWMCGSVLASTALLPMAASHVAPNRPLFTCRGTARGTSTLSVFAGAMWAAALLALTALAASQQATHRLRAWPDWRRLSGGGGGRGWLAGVVQLAAVAPVQLIACLCHPALRLRVRPWAVPSCELPSHASMLLNSF